MSFGKRHDARSLSDLPLDLQADMIRLVGLVGLWMVHLDLRGGQRYTDLKLQAFKGKLAKNIDKFERRPLIHELLRAAQGTPLPAPLPPDRVCDLARSVLSTMGYCCDPRDTGALRLVLIDMAQSVLQMSPPMVPRSRDPFFTKKAVLSERVRSVTRGLFRLNDPTDLDFRLSPMAVQAMQALVAALGAQDLWNLVPDLDHGSGVRMVGSR